MKVVVEYAAQARVAAGMAGEEVDLEGPVPVRELVVRLAGRHGEDFRRLVLDAGGGPHPSLLVFVGEEQVRLDDPRPLGAGDVVVVMTPISGG